jgi:NADH:ubiquinone oxidoreductase subunit F (NADH-binding)
MTGSTAAQTLTIAGSGFLSGAVVTASYAGGSSTNLTVTSLSATQIQATIITSTTARTWSITVTNTTGTASAAASLSVVAPSTAPVIGSVTPNPLTGSTAAQTLTIAGSGFLSGAVVTASYAGGSSTSLTVTSLSATQIQASIITSTTARTWSITVTNTTGTASAAASLSVVAPSTAPVIGSVTPNPMTGSTAAQTLTIAGSGFLSGAKVAAIYSGGSSTNLTVTSLSATQIQATIITSTTARTWSITVTNTTGTASAAASLSVVAPSTAPLIGSVTPNPMTGSAAAQTLTIAGSGFLSGAKVAAIYSGGSSTNLTVTSLSATQIQASIITSTTARTWSITVTNTTGPASNAASLSVVAPAVAPVIGSVTPNPMTGSTAPQTLTIAGSGFLTGAKVAAIYSGGSSTSLTVTSLSATQIQASIITSTTARTWSITVTNTTGPASNAASLTVVAPPVAPVVVSVTPNPMTGSTAPQTLTIAGSGFLSGAKVAASYAGGSSTSLTVISLGATQIQATITTGTTARTWSITVTNTTGPASNAGSLTVVASPAIVNVSPSPMTGANGNQIVTINGSGFVSGTALRVVVNYPGGSATTLSGGQIAFVSSTQVLALVNVGTTARTWTVQVINPTGMASNIVSLQVVAPPPPPAIASLTPNPMTHSTATQTLTINGSGFQAGTGLRVVLTTSGIATVLQSTSLQSASATQIKVAVNVGAMARTWTVQVVNPDGTPSLAATLVVK